MEPSPDQNPRLTWPAWLSSPAFWARYLAQSRRPLTSLLFLLPLLAFYEIGTLLLHSGLPQQRLLAHNLIVAAFGWIGVSGFWLPGVLLIAALLISHRLRRERWRVPPEVLPLMLVESVVLVLPLLAMNMVLLIAAVGGPGSAVGRVVVSMGAAVYEELVFRYFLVGGLIWLATRVWKFRWQQAAWVVVPLAALMFAQCHFEPVGGERYATLPYLLRFLAGIYLGIVFIGRGLGVTTGCHAAYNLLRLVGAP